MFSALSLAGMYTVFFFFLTLEADKLESKTFNKVGPENSTWKNYLSAKFQSYSEYACAVPEMTFIPNKFRNDCFCKRCQCTCWSISSRDWEKIT